MPPSETEKVRRELQAEHGDSPEVRRIVDQAVAFLERAAEAHAALVAHGSLTITVKSGIFPHPAVAIERTARLAFLTSLRVLRQRPKRTKIGAPMMGERLAAASRFFAPPATPARRRRAARYITPITPAV